MDIIPPSLPENSTKQCKICKIVKPLFEYRINAATRKEEHLCIKCRKPTKKKPEIPEGCGMCYTCHETKPVSEFSSCRALRNGNQSQCKKCDNERLHKRDADPVYREERLKRKRAYRCQKDYGMSLAEIQQKLDSQDRKCEICSIAVSGASKSKPDRSVVDHCHATNKVRGILCSNCNLALGLVKDNPDILRSAIEYLKKYSE